jgi:uncharacterized protein YbaP (TraB family)
MHVMKPTLLPLPQQFEDAFAASDRLVVEVNTSAVPAGEMQRDVSAMAFLPESQTIASVLRPDTLKQLNTYLDAQGTPPSSVARLRPAMIATQLAVARLMALGYLPEFGLDQYFIGRAGARPVLELETLDDQINLLLSPPMNVQQDMLASTLEQMHDVQKTLNEMVVAWLEGDADTLRRLFDEESPPTEAYREFDRELLDERNVGMADKIQGYLATSGSYFVLVGAAHLAGPASVIDVLRARGVDGRQIHSDDAM